MKNFWSELKKPIFILAPLANVTDVAFRETVARHGKPDVFFTEFVSADGLCSKGRDILMRDLKYTENQRPIVAQFFSNKPANIERCAALAEELGFDGVDINMGCPDGSVLRQGAGAALIKTPALAQEIIEAARRGAPSLPISVKTRIGYNQIEVEEWLPVLLKTDIAALSIHLRTMKEMSKVPAHWEVLKRIVEIKSEVKSAALIIGNGDVMSLAEGRKRTRETGADGVMLGRAIFGNPWLFAAKESFRENIEKSEDQPEASRLPQERLKALLELVDLHDQTWGETKNFDNLKKHFKAYVNDFPGASELRAELMTMKTAREVREALTVRAH